MIAIGGSTVFEFQGGRDEGRRKLKAPSVENAEPQVSAPISMAQAASSPATRHGRPQPLDAEAGLEALLDEAAQSCTSSDTSVAAWSSIVTDDRNRPDRIKSALWTAVVSPTRARRPRLDGRISPFAIRST
jgi:hypothetical protein